MAKLVLSHGGALIGEYPLQKPVVTIGRKKDNDIHIDNLAVSGRHARVVQTTHAFVLEDLNSTNGTYVNSKRVKRKALVEGDMISVGKHSLRFVSDVQRAERTEARTVVVPFSPREEPGVRHLHTPVGHRAGRARRSALPILLVLGALALAALVVFVLRVARVL